MDKNQKCTKSLNDSLPYRISSRVSRWAMRCKHVLQKKDSKTRETRSIITSYEWTLQDWPEQLRITNRTEEGMLDDREDDGRTVSETERDNKRLSGSR
jgi:hypothetical protein